MSCLILSKFFQEVLEENVLPIVLDNRRKPKYVINRGDVVRLGRHFLLCGDSTNAEEVKGFLSGVVVNAVITDPPYGINYSKKNSFLNAIDKRNRITTPILNDDICGRGFEDFYDSFFKVFVPFLADYNQVYVFCTGSKLVDLLNVFRKNGVYFSLLLVWIKNRHVFSRTDYLFQNEFIVYGWKGRHKFFGKKQTTVLNYDKPLVSKFHPTQKPIELLKDLVLHSTRDNGVVFDGFAGGGSTLLACELMNRVCYAVELDSVYCSVIKERWEELVSQKKLWGFE